ncbi:MAG: anion permease [Deltaproteobacteria bacterium]|nr:anion permease [Deltaproteobacteria bacterium]
MWVLSSSIIMGWALGGNHAGNIFGPAVTSNVFRFRTAALVTSFFIIVGALLEGRAGLETIGNLTGQTDTQAFICMFSAGLVVVLMTLLKLPISTSQAVIGSVIGAGLMGSGVHWGVFTKVVICWIGTPFAAAFSSLIFYILFSKIIKKINPNIFQMDKIIRWGLFFCCIYGAYALGANNVANTTGVFVKSGVITPFAGLVIGSTSMALGILTFSKRVIKTVGSSIVQLNGYAALVSLFASSFTIHFYAALGVPISTSQAAVGAILGIGFVKGLYLVNHKTIIRIFLAWICSPFIAIIITMSLLFFFQS